MAHSFYIARERLDDPPIVYVYITPLSPGEHYDPEMRLTRSATITWLAGLPEPRASLPAPTTGTLAGLTHYQALLSTVERELRALIIAGHPAQPTADELLSLRRAAELLGISRQATWLHIKNGGLCASREGSEYKVRRSDLAAFLGR